MSQAEPDPQEGERTLLREIARTPDSGDGVAELLQRIADRAREIVPAEGAFVEQLCGSGREVEVAAVSGQRVPRPGTRVPYPGSLAEEVIEQGHPEIVRAQEIRSRLLHGAIGEICGDCGGLILPLVSAGEAVGALVLVRSEADEAFRMEEADRLLSLTDLAALAVRRLLQAEESRARAQALAESERRFRLLVDGVREYAIFMLDPEGIIRSWNSGAERIKGYTAGEVVGRHFSLFYPPEELERGRPAEILADARQRGSHEEEGWRVRADGSRFWAYVLVTAIRSDGGELVGFSKVTRDLSERRSLEASRLRESERYRAIYEENPSIYLTTDSAGVVINVNAFGAGALGYSVRELIGTPAVDLVDPDHRELFLQHHQRCLDQPGRVQKVEFRKCMRDGTRIWVRESARAVTEEGGALVVLNVCEDITHRVEAEEDRKRLLEREKAAHERTREVLESITDAFFAVDREWRFTYLNAAAARAIRERTGAHDADLRGRVLWDVAPQLLGTRIESGCRQAMRTGDPVRFEAYVPGFGVWFETHAHPWGEGLSVFFRDITRRKHAEEALRASEEKFRQIAENVREVFWISDPDFGRVSYVSPAYGEVFGGSREALYEDASRLIERIVPEDRDAVESAFRSSGDGGFDLEFRIAREDGRRRWIRARGFPVRDEEGRTVRVVGIADDLTDRKETEEANRFFAEAGRLLASSLDYEQTLRNVARLSLRSLADWCVIDLVEDGEIRRLVVEAADPGKAEAGEEYQRRYPPDPDATTGGPLVIRTGAPVLMEEITEAQLEAFARDRGQFEILHELGLRSLIGATQRPTSASPRCWRTVPPSPSRRPGSTARHRPPPRSGTRCSRSSPTICGIRSTPC